MDYRIAFVALLTLLPLSPACAQKAAAPKVDYEDLSLRAKENKLSPEEVEQWYKKGQADWDVGDPIAALPKLKVAANGGNAKAQYLYAYLLDAADEDPQAFAYYQRAAEQGHLDAMFSTASFLANGEGGVTIDIARARGLFMAAADRDHIPSLTAVVMSFANGGLGISEEERAGEKALYWFKKGATHNLIPAVEKMAEGYREGKFTLKKSPEEAEVWRLKMLTLMGIDPNAKKKRQRR